MKKKAINKSILVPIILMFVILTGFIIYRVGPFSTIPIFTWTSLDKAHNLGEMTPVKDYSPSYNLLVISESYPLKEDMIPNISEYRTSGVLMATEITEDYGVLSDYIRENMNDTLYIESSYRSFEDQERVYKEEGSSIAALPGCSEHQSGLALDVYVMNFGGSAFTNSSVGKFVNTNCGDFGFIIRYPLGAEDITGFAYEPWHIRYVGIPHSQIIMDNKITLEEYINSFEIGSWYKYDNYLISRQEPNSIEVPSKYKDYERTISPDNMGYCIVTINTK